MALKLPFLPSVSSGASLGVNAYSGVGGFRNEVAPVFNKPFIDFDEPLHVLALSAVVVLGVIVYKKVA